MTAKEFLKQLKKIDTLISNKMAERQQWFDLATNMTPSQNGERVKSSGDQNKIATAMCNYIDLERQINEYIDELVEKRREVITTIEQLPEAEYDVLHKVYVQYKTLYEVADERERTYSWVTTVHGRALKHLDNILKAKKCN